MAKQTGETKGEKNIVKKVKPADKAKKKIVRKKKNIPRKEPIREHKQFRTHNGQILSAQQAKFIDCYIETGNARQSVLQAGYKTEHPDQYANKLLRIVKVIEEINYRMEQHKKESIANADEILQYYTKVMRGQEKDQFGLEAPLSERTKAASELAKRLIDIPNKLEANLNKAGMTGQATVTIALNWEGMEDNENAGEEENKEE